MYILDVLSLRHGGVSTKYVVQVKGVDVKDLVEVNAAKGAGNHLGGGVDSEESLLHIFGSLAVDEVRLAEKDPVGKGYLFY